MNIHINIKNLAAGTNAYLGCMMQASKLFIYAAFYSCNFSLKKASLFLNLVLLLFKIHQFRVSLTSCERPRKFYLWSILMAVPYFYLWYSTNPPVAQKQFFSRVIKRINK